MNVETNQFLIILIGAVSALGLIGSANLFVTGAANLSKILGMSPILIGVFIIGFGTSAPEILVSLISSFEGNPGIAMGNAYGSNITNLGLILGLTALLTPLTIHSDLVKKEIPLLILVSLISYILLRDGYLSRMDSFILVLIFGIYLIGTIKLSRKNKNDPIGEDTQSELKVKNISLKKSILWITGGLFFLVLSSRIMVWSAVILAKNLGVSDSVIGLTIVAIGTSLPELISTILAALRKEADLALGNIVGSNIFNTLIVVGASGLVKPFDLDPMLLPRDYFSMMLFTIFLLISGFSLKKIRRINRFEGAFFLLGYIFYTYYLISTV